MRKYLVNEDRVRFFELLTASFTDEATEEQLQALHTLTKADKRMRYEMQLLREMWFQEPETDRVAMQSAWEKIAGKILFYNTKDYTI